MFVSIVGHAIFQTAGRRGPSTIERSYRRRSGAPYGAGADGGAADVISRVGGSAAGLVTPSIYSFGVVV